MIRYILVTILLLSILFTNAHSLHFFSGDKLINLIGLNIRQAECKKFFAEYGIVYNEEEAMTDGNGMQVFGLNNKISEIHLYGTQTSNGYYAETLPKNIKFGMTKAEAKSLLGNPSSENDAFIEYNYNYYSIIVWFESDICTELSLRYELL